MVPNTFSELDGNFENVAADHARVRLDTVFISQEAHELVDRINRDTRNQVD
jgi:hypothetical protein